MRDVATFIHQLVIDRYTSIHHQLRFKKSKRRDPYAPLLDHYSPILHCGHDPHLVAICADQIILLEDQLELHYRIVTDRSNVMNLKYEPRNICIAIERAH
jgi:hypothetical protein